MSFLMKTVMGGLWYKVFAPNGGRKVVVRERYHVPAPTPLSQLFTTFWPRSRRGISVLNQEGDFRNFTNLMIRVGDFGEVSFPGFWNPGIFAALDFSIWELWNSRSLEISNFLIFEISKLRNSENIQHFDNFEIWKFCKFQQNSEILEN